MDKFGVIVLSLMINFCTPAMSQANRSGAAGKTPAKVRLAHPEVPRMPARELAQLIRKNADIIIVDTQPADGYQMWHIPSAINITFDAMADPSDRQLRLMELPANKPIVVYCLCEEGSDSARIALELWQMGYSHEKVKVLEGGLVSWDEKGYPIVKQKVSE